MIFFVLIKEIGNVSGSPLEMSEYIGFFSSKVASRREGKSQGEREITMDKGLAVKFISGFIKLKDEGSSKVESTIPEGEKALLL